MTNKKFYAARAKWDKAEKAAALRDLENKAFLNILPRLKEKAAKSLR